MPPLPPDLRKQLEKAVVQARVLAERGAKAALESLAVHHHEPHGSMTPEQRKLRNRLRAHGRQFGDLRDEKGAQEIGRLLREVAYEHWHRMLFARFLAENDLLIEPSNQVPVSLEEVEDLARSRSVDPWSMAALFAQRMLPQIFRPDDPVLQVPLPPETALPLQQLVVGLDAAVFTADDALGWTYQFWQSAEKDAVNARVKSGEKISGETLPAVTQLFTEHYMVQFLLHNTLGAWHACKVLAAQPELARTAQSESELRAAVSLPGYAFDYLRFVREGDAPWRPAAGTFAGWPRTAKELTVLDPCCGSGHFLVAAFTLLSTLRQQEEGLSSREAATAVLRDNLFGLELDARCVQIAAFALAMAAWKQVGLVVELPPLHVACCGLGPAGTKEQWLKLAEKAAAQGGMPVKLGLYEKEDSLLSGRIRNALDGLYTLFQMAPDLGSLIDPRGTVSGLFQADFSAIEPLFQRMLESEAAGDDAKEQAVAAQGMAKAGAILGQTFTLVATNVPFRKSGDLGVALTEFMKQRHSESKTALETVFISRIMGWLGERGTAAMVTPQNWLFLTSYRKLREKLLRERTWNLVARLGPKGFQTPMWDYNIMLVVLSATEPSAAHLIGGLDVAAKKNPLCKAASLRGEAATLADGQDEIAQSDSAERGGGEDEAAESAGPSDGTVKVVSQAEQTKNPDSRIVLSLSASAHLLSNVAHGVHGLGSKDSPCFFRQFWELATVDADWDLLQTTSGSTHAYGGMEQAVWWERGRGLLCQRGERGEAVLAGSLAWGKNGVLVSQIGNLPTSLHVGDKFDKNAAVILPAEGDDLAAIWCFCCSPEFSEAVRRIDQSLKVTNASLVKVPFDIAYWEGIAAEQYPQGLPEPQTNDPTQWLFHGHPAGMTAAGRLDASPFEVPDILGHTHPSLLCRTPSAADVLQVATARLLGYRWPAELDLDMRLDKVQRAWTTRSAELLPFADADGIVCLNPTRGEPSAADRLREFLQCAFGPRWLPDTERRLLAAAAGPDGDPAPSIHDWLVSDFFAAHCKLFHDRPFVWHLWDGRKDGFHALVNYHKLAGPGGEGRRTLERLAFTYLDDWIARQRADSNAGEAGADARLAAALDLQEELKRILHGEPPYDLFIRWKPLHQQPLGWEPDIDDGVRLNIRPFVLAKDVKQKGAGLLRSKVSSVKWTKDRGKEPEKLRPRASFPWFWSRDPDLPAHQRDYEAAKTAAFDGVRWNDLHYSRAAKEAARQRMPDGKETA